MTSTALVMLLAGLFASSDRPAKAPNQPVAATRTAGAYHPVALTTDWRTKVRVVSVTHDQWMRELEALRGRIIVVDNWATWCAPCIERFPRMMTIVRHWSRSGVVFVTLSLDDRDDPQSLEKVRQFLKKNDARIPNYLMNEITPDAFDKLGLLGIPAVFIYNREGKLIQRLTGDDPNHQFTEADVEAAIRKLTAAK